MMSNDKCDRTEKDDNYWSNQHYDFGAPSALSQYVRYGLVICHCEICLWHRIPTVLRCATDGWNWQVKSDCKNSVLLDRFSTTLAEVNIARIHGELGAFLGTT